MLRGHDLDSVRAGWWTLRAVRSARHQLPRTRLEAIVLPPVPPVPSTSGKAMSAVLERTRSTCLVKSLVRQAWHAAHGRDRDVVIGVTSPRDGFRAHAWLDGDPDGRSGAYTEISRRAAG